MLKDRIFKISCAVAFAFIQLYALAVHISISVFVLCSSAVFFLIGGYFLIHGSVKILNNIRNRKWQQNVYIKLCLSLLSILAFSWVLIIALNLIWQSVVIGEISWSLVYSVVSRCIVLILFYTLVYEILFLTKERELDNKVVKQLDSELMQAEVNFLKNELDPHFVYNCLMPLYYLIKNNVPQAEQFTYKLMQVYQHFLQNRQKDFVPFNDELCFIENYFYLLRIRFKDSLVLTTEINDADQFQVIPFTLQLLIENAIKHNSFDNQDPLQITVRVKNSFLLVQNKMIQSPEDLYSSKVGLRNLRMRYRILMNRNIYVFKDKEFFTVKVPLLRKSNQNDVRSHYRG